MWLIWNVWNIVAIQETTSQIVQIVDEDAKMWFEVTKQDAGQELQSPAMGMSELWPPSVKDTIK